MTHCFTDRISNLKPSAIREILKFTADPTVISFAAGNPAPEAFPVDIIKKLSAEIFEENPVLALQYSVSEGYTPLRNLLKEDLMKKDLFRVSDDDLIVTSGAQQAIEMATKVLCNEGECIICEAPSFIGSLNAFRSYNAKLVGVEMEDDGISIEKLELALKENPKCAFIYLIPNFQNPTGITMSEEKRRAVYELAVRNSILIVEDNPYGDLRFSGADVPSIKSMDKEGIVIYVGSFSKILAPGLRVGYMCAPTNIIQKVVVAKQVSDVHSNIWAQCLCYKFMQTVNIESHLINLRNIYKRKFKLMLDNLNFNMPTSIEFTEPDGGLFIWGTLPYTINMQHFCKKAVENKVAVVPGNAFMMNESDSTNSFRLNFSTPTDEQIVSGVETLSKVAKKLI